MSGTSWLVDSRRIATKIKSASESLDPGRVKWKSNPTRACPNCNHVIDNSDVSQEWPGLPRGVKFDPSDQEIIWHLLSKVGRENAKPHPFIEEFIPTVDEDDGICYAHPQNLPGVKQDGSVSHFFHRAIKAYNTGTRKRRKIQGDDLGDVRWHKTGRTKPVFLDGIQRGCKKIMVLYMSNARGGKPEKTNWVMHQYHLGTGEDEKDGEFVVSKVFYQQQSKPGDKVEQDLALDIVEITAMKVDPVTPNPVIRDPPRIGKQYCDAEHVQEPSLFFVNPAQNPVNRNVEDEEPTDYVILSGDDNLTTEDQENPAIEDPHSQSLGGELNTQQLFELCNGLHWSQSPNRDDDGRKTGLANEHQDMSLVELPKDGEQRNYALVGSEEVKQELLDFQNIPFDSSVIGLDTPPDLDFRLSQLEFGSQDVFGSQDFL